MRDQARMRALVDEHSRLVERTLQKAGVSPSDLDDEVQRTFIVAAGRLDDIAPGSEPGFLVRVAYNVAAHLRRSYARRIEVPVDRLPDRSEPRGTPEDLARRKQERAVVHGLLGEMDEQLRAVFVRYELDGMTMKEIASALRIPGGTVASRLRRARERLHDNVQVFDLAWEVGLQSTAPVDGPSVLRRTKVSALARALLEAGMATPRSSTKPRGRREAGVVGRA